MKFRKKPVVIEATQWRDPGDEPSVSPYGLIIARGEETGICKECGEIYNVHGYVKTLEGGHIVCPGDWIITGVKGEKYPCKDAIFKLTYEPAE